MVTRWIGNPIHSKAEVHEKVKAEITDAHRDLEPAPTEPGTPIGPLDHWTKHSMQQKQPGQDLRSAAVSNQNPLQRPWCIVNDVLDYSATQTEHLNVSIKKQRQEARGEKSAGLMLERVSSAANPSQPLSRSYLHLHLHLAPAAPTSLLLMAPVVRNTITQSNRQEPLAYHGGLLVSKRREVWIP